MADLEPKYLKILRALLEAGEMNFGQVVNVVHNRPAARNRLDELIRLKFVKDLRPEAKHGLPGQFVLTKDGYGLAVSNLFEDIENGLRQVDVMVARLSDPRQLSQLRKWLHEKRIVESEFLTRTIQEGELTKEEFKKVLGSYHKSSGVLTKILRDLQRIYVKVEAPQEMRSLEFLIGFPESQGGGPFFVPLRLYEDMRKDATAWRREQKAKG